MNNTRESYIPQSDVYDQFRQEAQVPTALHEGLQPDVLYRIDPNMPLARDEKYGCYVTAMITADRRPEDELDQIEPPDSFILLDVRSNTTFINRGIKVKFFGNSMIDANVDFMLVNPNLTDKGSQGSKGIRLGESVMVGRHNKKLDDRFGLQMSTSREHFSITYNESGLLTIQDHNSLNGTGVITAAPLREQQQWQSRKDQEEAFRPREEAPRAEPPREEPRPKPEANEYGLDAADQHRLDELNRLFAKEMANGEIDSALMAAMLKHITNLRNENIPDNKILKQVARDIHPDKVAADTTEHARRTALLKALNITMGR